MGFQKHGDGQILPEPGQKTASDKDWDEEDARELQEENDKADKER